MAAIILAALLPIVAAAHAPAKASCAQSRRFVSNYTFALDDETWLPTGVFWARGSGDPAAGPGIDNGLCSPGDFYYGTPGWAYPFSRLDGDWNQPGVDGCIDAAGATAALTGDECMVVLLSDEAGPLDSPPPSDPDYGRFALVAAPALPGADPVFSLSVPEWLAPIPKPTILDTAASASLAQVTVDAGPGLFPEGLSLHPACSVVPVEGYRVFGLQVPAGAPVPVFLDVEHGWTALSAVAPFGSRATVTLDCTSGNDVYLSVVPSIDGGFMTHHVSGVSRRVNTATDTDLDTSPDACDPCTDVDADGFGDPGFLSNVCGQDDCPAQFNPSQADSDADGVGDACEYCATGPDPRPTTIVSDPGWNTERHLNQYAISDDGQHVVYEAFVEPAGFALFSVPSAGGPAVRLIDPLPPGRRILALKISPDSAYVLFQSDRDVAAHYDAFSVPIAGGVVHRLIDPVVPLGGSGIVGFGPDSSTVLLTADPVTLGVDNIYKAPIDGSSAPIQVTPSGGLSRWALSPDGATLVFWDQTDMYSMPSAGGSITHMTGLLGVRPASTVSPALFSPDNRTFVFFQDFGTGGSPLERGALFSAPIAGGGSTQISMKMNIPKVRVTPDSAIVVFLAENSANPYVDEVFRVGIGGGPITKLNQPTSFIGVHEFEVSPDGARVVYVAGIGYPTSVDTLLSVPIAGGPSVQLNPSGRALHGNLYGGPSGFLFTPDGQTFVYRMSPTPMLRSVPVAGGTSTALSLPGQNVSFQTTAIPPFALTPDGRTVVYLSRGPDGLLELRSAPVSTGQILTLSDPFVRDHVFEFQMSRDGSRAVYKAAPGLHITPVHSAADTDGDTAPDGCDACTDTDHDGFGDPGFAASTCGIDNCPAFGNDAQADADGDGHGDVCDNCTAATNAAQADRDGDGAGDACDCAPDDPATHRPAAVAGMSLEHMAGGGALLTWSAAAGADLFAVTRGPVTGLAAGRLGACVAPATTGSTYEDADIPPVRQAWIYLVQGRSLSCGAGTLGFTSGGAERSNQDPEACGP